MYSFVIYQIKKKYHSWIKCDYAHLRCGFALGLNWKNDYLWGLKTVKSLLSRHCERSEANQNSITSLVKATGLLRFARNDGLADF